MSSSNIYRHLLIFNKYIIVTTVKSHNPKLGDREYLRYDIVTQEAGDSRAQYFLGLHYSRGSMGLPREYSKAFELWTRAAELGDMDAHRNLGVLYSEGVTPSRYEESKSSLGASSSARSRMARHNLGCIEMKRGNMQRAMKYFMILQRLEMILV